MRHKYRGQLSNSNMVDILDFEGEFANCDHGVGKIHIDEFNTIFFPKDTFKKDILGVEIEVKEVAIPRSKNKSK